MLSSVTATDDESRQVLPGDEVLPHADVVMTRAFSVEASRDVVWPWLEQLGKRRAGWYLPSNVERFIPGRRRAIRRVDPGWLGLDVGDVIPDYGGKHETFTVRQIQPSSYLVYWSRRRNVTLTWSLSLHEISPARTRILLRLRLAGLKRPWLAKTFGGPLDGLTIAGMAAGLRERLAQSSA